MRLLVGLLRRGRVLGAWIRRSALWSTPASLVISDRCL